MTNAFGGTGRIFGWLEEYTRRIGGLNPRLSRVDQAFAPSSSTGQVPLVWSEFAAPRSVHFGVFSSQGLAQTFTITIGLERGTQVLRCNANAMVLDPDQAFNVGALNNLDFAAVPAKWIRIAADPQPNATPADRVAAVCTPIIPDVIDMTLAALPHAWRFVK